MQATAILTAEVPNPKFMAQSTVVVNKATPGPFPKDLIISSGLWFER